MVIMSLPSWSILLQATSSYSETLDHYNIQN
jgi:hypothetical protein